MFECVFPIVLLLSFDHIRGRGGCWNLGLFQPDQGGCLKCSVHTHPNTQTVLPIYVNIFVSIGYWRYNEFLQGNIQKLSRHQTGRSEKNTPSHPAWSKISSLSPYFLDILCNCNCVSETLKYLSIPWALQTPTASSSSVVLIVTAWEIVNLLRKRLLFLCAICIRWSLKH